MKDKNYSGISDEGLVRKAQSGDADAEEYLIRKYKNTVSAKAKSYFIIGADMEDVVQEGMIGLFKAIKSFNSSKQASFHTFADLCINRQIITAIKLANRRKHSPLNSSVSLNRPMDEEEKEPPHTLEETLRSDSNTDPETLMVLKEIVSYIIGNEGRMFSDFEMKVWNEFLQGKSYARIAEDLGKSPKAIDNAMQRTKKKIEAYLSG